jgi:outer membrane autotransporter protein
VWNGKDSNWVVANGTMSGLYNPASFLIFSTVPGVVSVDAGAARALQTSSGMQFAVDGYRVQGDGLILGEGNNVIRVGNGVQEGASFSVTLASMLSGSGALVLDDLGTLILTTANTYSGGTNLKHGILQLGDGGTSGSIVGDVNNDAILAFNRVDNVAFSGVISGTGAVRQSGLGTLTLLGVNRYTGGTTIARGTLVGSSSSFGSGAIRNEGALVIEQDTDASFTSVINGNGSFTKRGVGGLNLTAVSALSGPTSIEAGSLTVNGSLVNSSVTVLAGARLGGNGTIGGLLVRSGATVAPGNSIGTLNVAGNVSFEAGAVYEVETNAAGQADRISATGSATLAGKVSVLAGSGNYAPDTRYTILSAAGGRSGQFASVTSNLAFLDPMLSYDSATAYLNLIRNDIGFGDIGGTFNQRAAGAGIESLGRGHALWDTTVQMDESMARAAFDQVSGEIHATAKMVLLDDSRFVREVAFDRLRGTSDEGSVAWGRLFGSWGSIDSDGNAASLNRDTSGVFFGADGQFSRVLRLGLLGGYSRTSVDSVRGDGNSRDAHLAAYAGGQWGALALRGGVAYSRHAIDTARLVSVGKLSDTLRNDDSGADMAQMFGEVGYRFGTPMLTWEPFVNLARVRLAMDAFSEQGGIAALKGYGDSMHVSFSTVGLHGQSALTIGSGNAVVKSTLGWRHVLGAMAPLSTQSFINGTAFTVAGAPIAGNAAVIDLGLDFMVGSNTVFSVSYDGQFDSAGSDNGVRVKFGMRF